MRTILIGMLVVLVTGCSTFQPSEYTNYNTPYGNVTQATGRAADNAALANTSYNCPSCAVTGQNGGGNGTPQYRDYSREQHVLNDLTMSTLRTISTEVSLGVSEAIRDALR